MTPFALLVPLVGIGGFFAVKKIQANAAVAKANTVGGPVPIPGGTGTVTITTGGPTPDVQLSQLPPAFQAILTAGGKAPSQADINETAAALAQGIVTSPDGMLKDRNNVIFNTRQAPFPAGTFPAGGIQPGDRVTFDLGTAGLTFPFGGSSVITVTSPSTADSVSGNFCDPRVPVGAVTIPVNSVGAVLTS